MSIRQGDYLIAGAGGGGAGDIDNKSITNNASNKIQTVGVIDQNNTTNAIKSWSGTKLQYDALVNAGTIDNNTLYYITDDNGSTNQPDRNIGEIIQSTLPLTDAGLHLLDGSLISGSGSYAEFVAYIAGLVTDYPSLFETEANWQTSVTNYGACDKYVYDSVNNTIRLPKRTTEHGDLIKSYSSGTDWYRVYSDGWCEQGGIIVSTGSSQYKNATFLKPFSNTDYFAIGTLVNENTYSGIRDKTTSSVSFFTTSSGGNKNADVLWRACGYTNVSDYQQSPVYEYIVIATSAKTQIEVDIDEIATDLNGKADVDLSNMNPTQTVKNTIVGWVMPDYSAGIAITLYGSNTYTAPSKGLIQAYTTGTANATYYVNGNIAWEKGQSSSSAVASCIEIYCEKDDVVSCSNVSNTGYNTRFYPLKGVN